MLDMFAVDQQNLMSQAASSPLPTSGATPGETFSANLAANQGAGRLDSEHANAFDFVQQHLDAYEAKTGESLRNPMAIPLTDANAWAFRAQRMQAVRDKFADYATKSGDASMAFPTDDEIQQGAVGMARQVLSRQEQIAAGPQSLAARAAGALGSLVGAATDPFNAVAIATIPEGGLATKVLGSAAIFGGQALATDIATYGFKSQVDPQFGPGQVVADTAENAIGGAAFELGGQVVGRAAGALWRRFKTVAPEIADRVPQETQDAANVAERVAELQAQNPFKGSAGEAAHNEALVKIEADLRAGRPPELPPAALEPANAIGPTEAEISAHAAATNPDLHGRVGDLEAQIGEARRQVGEMAASPFDRDIAGESAARLHLNDLQQQRAALGPEVNASRQSAENFLRGHPETPAPEATAAAPISAATETPPVQVTAGQAFGDQPTIAAAAAHPYKGVNRIAEAMEDAAPAWQAMRDAAKRGDIPPTFDVTEHLMGAVKALIRARDEGKTIAEVMNNGPAFHSDTAQLATRMFFRHDSAQFLSRAQMRDNLRSLADGLRETPKVEAPARAPIDPATARLMRDATTPEALAKAPDDPKVHDAMAADLQRNIEQGRNRVPVDDGAGGVKLGFADKELQAIDGELAAAKEIGACASPVAEAA